MNFFRKTDKVANANHADDGAGGPKSNSAAEKDKIATCKDDKVVGHAEGNDTAAAAVSASAIAADKAIVGDAGATVAKTAEVTVDADDDDVEGALIMSNVPLDSSHDDSPSPTPSKQVEKDGEREHDEESEGEYTDGDDDSEYTYETVEEEDDAPKKSAWFGFLRRKKHEGDEEFSESEGDHSDEEGGAAEGEKNEAETNVDKPPDEEHESDDDSKGKHPLLTSSSSSDIGKSPSNEAEEAILMAQAIERVQHRIQSNGGNLYEALSEQDKQLVDSLKGAEDEDKIREVVGRNMDRLEKEVQKGKMGEGGLDEAEFSQLLGKEDDTSHVQHNHAENPQPEPSLDTEPSLHKEPSLDSEQRRGLSSLEEPKSHVEPSVDVEPLNESFVYESEDGDDHGKSGDEDDGHDGEGEEEDDEQPTLEEQRSLLSLAAEHDRVDVIKELLSDTTDLYESLLAGIDGATVPALFDNGAPNEEATFVPPPLHAAVAAGSINAASCLLRMGADPSIRPVVPDMFLSGAYQASPLKRSGSASHMEEDRNYKKYHGMSAWELAFGSTVVVENGEVGVDDELVEEVHEETKRGWFGFGSSPKKDNESSAHAADETAGTSGKRRIKRKQPLNIPPQKLEGLKHAFTAEALRAIGSDEVDRLAQLLNAGMESSMEVAGKSLTGWAGELDAKACCELLNAGMETDENQKEFQHHGAQEDSGVDIANGDSKEVTKEVSSTDPSQTAEAAQPPIIIQDERLTGLSLSDIQTLTNENLTLLPHLTQVHDDLASETFICQSILRDIASTGGRGGLSSQSLLDLVRTLKDQRARAEEAANAWQTAWEEREDELDFFWEEVVDEQVKNELGSVLSQVDVSDPNMLMSSGTNSNESIQRFIEVDNQTSSLRTSIANLAEESAKYTAEIEQHGMSGALSLTKSLRGEVKEMETKMNEARMGEGVCRRKIEIIQGRLGHGNNNEGNGVDSQQEENVDEKEMGQRETDVSMEDYQLKMIVQHQEQQRELDEGRGNPSPPLVELPEHKVEAKPTSLSPELNNGNHHDETPSTGQEMHASPVEAGIVNENEAEDYSSGDGEEESSQLDEEGSVDEEEDQDYASEHDGYSHEVDEDVVETVNETNDIIEEEGEMEATEKSVRDEEESRPSAASVPESTEADEPSLVNQSAASQSDERSMNGDPKVTGDQALKMLSTTVASDSKQQPKVKKPSESIAKGMSTAIVVHSNVQAGSLSSQIWEILRRIVGLRRVQPLAGARSESYHDAHENHPHIMIV